MLTYHLNKSASDALYLQLYQALKEDILSGKLPADEKLPGKRPFASHLGLSVITIENAYEALKAEGYIYSVPKKGYFVTSDLSLSGSPRGTSSEAPSRSLSAKNPETVSGDKTMDNFQPNNHRFSSEERIDLSVNRVLPDLFPFSVWAKESRRILSAGSSQLLEPAPGRGVRELRAAIAGHLRSFRGIDVSPDQIVIGAGTEYLYGLLIQLLGRDHIYGVEDPGYQKIRKVYDANGVRWLPVSIDQKGAPLQELLSKEIQILHISPSHHFPTGRVMPIGRRYELLSWSAEDEDRFIIEDDYDSELRLDGRPIPALYGIDRSEKVIYMNTFSKSLAPTLRISYMVLPQTLSEKFGRELGFYSCTVGSLTQYTLAAFMQHGHFEIHLNRLRRYYRQWHSEMMSQFAKSPALKQARVMEDAAGLHFLLKLPSGIRDSELKEIALSCGLKVSCLSDYYKNPGDSEPGILVINYSSLEKEKLPLVVERLGTLARRLLF